LTEFFGEDGPTHGTLTHERWRRYASPVWTDIRSMRTLNVAAAREASDVRHIAAMSLDMIDRAVQLWSNPGDIIFDPFTGIGSTGYEAVKAGRRFCGAELKNAYWRQAVVNLKAAEQELKSGTLFGETA
jgi:DNA modification methylase